MTEIQDIKTFRRGFACPGPCVLVRLLLLIALAIGVDQATKIYARDHFQDQGTIQVVGNFFVIHYAENDGSFLSLGSTLPEPLKFLLLTLLPVAVLLYFTVYMVFHTDLATKERVTLAVILAGGYSNIVDRILFHGWVTDFLHFSLGFVRTGILNVADMYITFGVIFFLYLQYVKEKERKAQLAAEMSSESDENRSEVSPDTDDSLH